MYLINIDRIVPVFIYKCDILTRTEYLKAYGGDIKMFIFGHKKDAAGASARARSRFFKKKKKEKIKLNFICIREYARVFFFSFLIRRGVAFKETARINKPIENAFHLGGTWG